MYNNIDQAFPIPEDEGHPRIEGLTRLDYFAAKALQGELANSRGDQDWTQDNADKCARRCITFAKAVLKQLAEEGKK